MAYSLIVVAAVVAGQYAPVAPESSWRWTRFTDGRTGWAWGWVDASGYMHVTAEPRPEPEPKPAPERKIEQRVAMGEVDATGAKNYGVISRSIRDERGGAIVRASSPAAERRAYRLASGDVEDADRCRPDDHVVLQAIAPDVRKAFIASLSAAAVVGAAVYALRGRK